MPNWVIGDVHGCADTLDRLLDAIDHDPQRDRLHFVGDLINRGPDNLRVLRRVRALGDRATAVLGNHEVHALGVAVGARALQRKDTLEDVLIQDTEEGWTAWIASWPLIRTVVDELGREALVVHAGLHPSRTTAEWVERSIELSNILTDAHRRRTLLEKSRAPAAPHPTTHPDDLARLDLAILTRMRVCAGDGTLDYAYKGPPREAPEGLVPWYRLLAEVPERPHLYTGHWAAHGFSRLEAVTVMDSGCVWGNELSAFCLETQDLVSVPALEMR